LILAAPRQLQLSVADTCTVIHFTWGSKYHRKNMRAILEMALDSSIKVSAPLRTTCIAMKTENFTHAAISHAPASMQHAVRAAFFL
jgi:hypothetical protein